MHINKVSPDEYRLKKMINVLQNYAYNPTQNKSHISLSNFSRDLYCAGESCNTSQLKQKLNYMLVQLAQKMTSSKQDSFAGIIYNFIIKTNKDNPSLLKTVEPKALDIALKQHDSVHVASRAGELATLYKDNNGEMYLKYLNLKEEALKDVCKNYEQLKDRYKTISRPLNTKTSYVLTLIRTELNIALYKEKTNPKEARKELVSILNKINNPQGDYFVEDIAELNKIKIFLKTKLTKDILYSDENSLKKSFSITSKKLLNSVKDKEPLNIEILGNYFSTMYDQFKDNSLELEFIHRSITLIDYLNKLDNHIVASKLYTVMFEKNKNNPKNIKIIAKHGFNQRKKEKDDFGIVFFGQKLAKVLKECDNFAPSEYLNTLGATMEASKNIINNYEELSSRCKLRPKNDYLRDLIFDKVSVAKFIRKRTPNIAANQLQEANELIKALPKQDIEENVALQKLRKHILSLINTQTNKS